MIHTLHHSGHCLTRLGQLSTIAQAELMETSAELTVRRKATIQIHWHCPNQRPPSYNDLERRDRDKTEHSRP